MKKDWKKRAAAMMLSVVMVGQVLTNVDEATISGMVKAAAIKTQVSFEENAALQLEKTAGATIGTANPEGGVAEIVAYNSDNKKAYVVNGQQGILNVLPVQEDGSFGEGESIAVQNLVEGFAYGDMTSVAVDTVNDRIAIALQAQDYRANGKVAILDYEGNLFASYDTGVQPDMVTFTKDGSKVLTANEGEPREGFGEGTEDPVGSVTIVDLTAGTAVNAGFEAFDAEVLAENGILLNKVNGEIQPADKDLEPEYIAVNDEGTKAYVTLQEANAVAVLDLIQGEIIDVKSLGFVDLSLGENAIDLIADTNYEAKTYENAYGVRMPDGISIFERDGKTYLITANEGDAREWGTEDTPAYFCNEGKATLTATDGTQVKKVRVLDTEYTAGLKEGKNYLFGSRSFSIFDAETMELLYDSGNAFEQKTAQYLPEYFNCSNDDIELDSRSQKKGPEAESVTIGNMDGKTYAFIALERIGGVMVYDITSPDNAKYINYINTREFSEDIAGDVAPEGLTFIPANDSANGLPMLLAACEVSGTVAGYSITGIGAQSAVILYTNDVHCAIDGYSSLAAYSEQMTEEGYRNILVDAGDAIQGDTIGALTKGEAIVKLMNQTGYELAVPGNHEFDYKMDRFLELAELAEYDYIAANFTDLTSNKTVLDSYQIKNVGGKKVAFIGISTPETYTKSSPAYFQNEDGEYIYSFNEDKLYEVVQNAVDSAKEAGADYVVAIGHTGIEGTTDEWKATSVIANTAGIDVYLDAHSHETIPHAIYKNKEEKEVILSSTGTKFENIGKLLILPDGTITTELIKVDEIAHDTTAGVKASYNEVQKTIDTYNIQVEEDLGQIIGTSEVELTINDTETGKRRIRNGETNMGDFVADAYRACTDAEIALVNGGGIRASIEQGDISKKIIMAVNPWSNSMCVVKATGKEIVDALEHGVKNYPEESGGFLQVSGLTYEINKEVEESPVVVDDKGMFVSIDTEKVRRVQNVKVNGIDIDLEKNYTVAGSQYTLLECGDGYTMFKDNQVMKKDGLLVDAEMLIAYFTENLNALITAEKYGQPSGEGRIRIVKGSASEIDKPVEKPNGNITETTTKPSENAATQLPADTPSDAAAQNAEKKITVKKASISSIKNVADRKIQLTLKKISGINGYQIKYSTSKKFKEGMTKTITTSKRAVTLKKLKKGKTYYIKVRAYKLDANKKKVYGKYSSVKKIKIKK